MALRAGKRSQVQDEQLDIFERRLLVFLEPEAEPAGGKAAVAVMLFPPDQCRQLERLGDRHAADLSRGHLGEYEVVAFQGPLKIVRGWPCEVDTAPPRGRAASPVYYGGKPCNRCHVER